LEDIFALQDEITATVVIAIGPELSRAEQDRARRKRPDDLGAWDCYQRGIWHVWRSTAEDNTEAVRLFNQATGIDPHFADAYSGLAAAHLRQIMLGYTDDARQAREAGTDAAKRALVIDDQDAGAYAALSMAAQFTRENAAAAEAARKALAISPSHAFAHMSLGISLNHLGQPGESLAVFDEAETLSPRDPMIWLCFLGRAVAHILLDDFGAAVAACRKGAELPHAPYMLQFHLLYALTKLSRPGEARKVGEELLRLKPDFTVGFARRHPGVPEELVADYMDALKEAGIPEE